MGKSLITGIDIGHHSIKAVVLKPASEGYSLVGYKQLPVTADVFSDNHTVNYQKIVKKLKELRKSLPLFSRYVSISVPDSAVISKVLQIDSELEEREQEFAIFQAFSHQSPFPIEELNLDFVPLDSSLGQPLSSRSYQVYATKKDVIDSRTLAATKAGFKPVLLDTQAHSLVRIWQQASQQLGQSDWLLVDIGYSQTSLCIDFPAKAPFCKEIAFGTQFLECEEPSGSLAPERTELFINQLIERLQRQMQLLLSVSGAASVSGIWLTGGGATTPLLVEELSRRLSVQCEILNPLALFKCKSSKFKQQTVHAQSFTSAAGLALRGAEWVEAKHAI
ncbi:type IV pilus assembly protein PilM [Vibrio paucivorans]